MQGLKSDIDVISVSGPSLKSQYGESFAAGSTSREVSQMHRQSPRLEHPNLLVWLPTEDSQETSQSQGMLTLESLGEWLPTGK